MEWLNTAYVGATGMAFCMAYVGVPLMIRCARQLGVIDRPDGVVKTHEKPVPYLGGVAVYVSFAIALLIFYPHKDILLWLLGGCGGLLLLGLVDDLAILSPAQKFFGQFLVVAVFLRGATILKPSFFAHHLMVPIAGFWMLSIVNAFNLVDVMDGLAAVLSISAALCFGVLAVLHGDAGLIMLLSVFCAAMGGFFIYNKPPARIYLGDAGALCIGGFLSMIPFFVVWPKNLMVKMVASILILAVPLIEVTALVIIRSALGIPFYRASPHHFSLYLRRKGWSVWQVLGWSAIWSVIFGSFGVLLATFPGCFIPVLGCTLFFLVIWSIVIFK